MFEQHKQPMKIDNLPAEASQRGEDSEQRVIDAMERYGNSSVMPLILNRKQRKLVQEELIEELSQGFELRRKAIGMALETRLHSIREACNHVLVTGKTQLRQQRLEYFGDILRQVEQRMNELAEKFLLDMDERFNKLDQYNNDIIRDREKIRLEKSIEDFLNTLDCLIGEFRNIINEHIDHHQPVE